MLTSIAGATWSARAGQVIDVSDAEGARLVKAGHATAVKQTKVEKATTRSK